MCFKVFVPHSECPHRGADSLHDLGTAQLVPAQVGTVPGPERLLEYSITQEILAGEPTYISDGRAELSSPEVDQPHAAAVVHQPVSRLVIAVRRHERRWHRTPCIDLREDHPDLRRRYAMRLIEQVADLLPLPRPICAAVRDRLNRMQPGEQDTSLLIGMRILLRGVVKDDSPRLILEDNKVCLRIKQDGSRCIPSSSESPNPATVCGDLPQGMVIRRAGRLDNQASAFVHDLEDSRILTTPTEIGHDFRTRQLPFEETLLPAGKSRVVMQRHDVSVSAPTRRTVRGTQLSSASSKVAVSMTARNFTSPSTTRS